MKKNIKIATAISAVLMSSTAFGVAGMDRSVFSPSILFEVGNFAELTLANSNPTVTSDLAKSANVADKVNTINLAYKRKLTEKIGLGMIVNTQPVGVDIDYKDHPGGIKPLRGSVSAKSLIALGHYSFTEQLSAFGGFKYQTQEGSANVPRKDPNTGATIGYLPAELGSDSDTGIILGAAFEKPEIAFRASLSYESNLDFSHKTTSSTNPTANGLYSISPDSTSSTPKAWTLELQSGIAKDTLLFGSIRKADWADAQVSFIGKTPPLSDFKNTTSYKIGLGRKFNESFSGSVTLNYEKSSGDASSAFSPQDGEKGIAFGGKYTGKNGLITSLGIQYRMLGDTVTTADTGSIPFSDNDIVTVGLKVAKSF